jgi:hypothetical protein
MIMVSSAMTRVHKTSGHSVATIAETMSAPTATYSCAAVAWRKARPRTEITVSGTPTNSIMYRPTRLAHLRTVWHLCSMPKRRRRNDLPARSVRTLATVHALIRSASGRNNARQRSDASMFVKRPREVLISRR